MIKWLEIKNTFRNKRFILFTLLLPSFWYLFMLGFSDSFKLHGQSINYILYLTAALIGISGNSIVTFSKKISTTRSFYQLQRLTSHYSFNRWLIDQLVVQIMLNTIICIVLIVLGEIYQAIPFTFTFLVLLLLVLILGIYLSIIGFWIGIRLDGATISALSMPLSTGFSLLMFPWSGYISGNNWFLKVTFFIQKFFPGYYISEQLERMQNNQNTLTTVLLFILTNMAIFVPTVFLLKKSKKLIERRRTMNYKGNKNLHNYIKENYENGRYSRDYTYHGTYSHSNSKNYKSTSDFKRGCEKYQQDKANGHIDSWYYASIIRILNKIFIGKMQEVVDFMDGYQYEKQKNN